MRNPANAVIVTITRETVQGQEGTPLILIGTRSKTTLRGPRSRDCRDITSPLSRISLVNKD